MTASGSLRSSGCGSNDCTLRLWDVATRKTVCTLEGHTSSVDAAAAMGDGRRVFSGSHDRTLRLWDLANDECLNHYATDSANNCLPFARDDLIVAGSEDGRIHILEIREP